jgi:hypothetical protein
LEDLVTVIDGRENLAIQIDRAPTGLRGYGRDAVRALLATAAFDEALTGYLPGDRASQARLPGLRQKLQAMAALT